MLAKIAGGYGGRARRLVNRAGLALAAILLTAQAAPAPVTLLAFGDSLTAGYDLAPEDTFPVRLEARLAADRLAVRVINGGFSGDTTAGGLGRIKWSLQDKPQYALVELGANDALRGIAPAVAEANLDKILARFRDAGVRVLLVGMQAPSNWGPDYKRQFDAIYPRLAKKYGVPLYPFFLDGVALDPSLTLGDGLHPNAAGVQVIVARIAPAVEKLLKTRPLRGSG